ncbi:hypothetical protein [Aliivibrio fischeri]|uniref:hypothetical protein n=1 Tax=Aliivibrio fischeri TaxID=668 RepID=UPI0007C567C8|nr:hypothetical protein [Aliivibrio fischeri]
MKKLLLTILLLMFSSYSFSEQESVTVPTQGLSTISPTLTEPIEMPSCLKQGKENLQGFERSKKTEHMSDEEFSRSCSLWPCELCCYAACTGC